MAQVAEPSLRQARVLEQPMELVSNYRSVQAVPIHRREPRSDMTQRSPAADRSRPCRARWSTSAFAIDAGNAIMRRLRFVFGSTSCRT